MGNPLEPKPKQKKTEKQLKTSLAHHGLQPDEQSVNVNKETGEIFQANGPLFSHKVDAFYSALSVIYESKFSRVFSPAAMADSKTHHSARIDSLTSDQIRLGFAALEGELLKGNKKYEFPNILTTIGFCQRHGEISWEHNTKAYKTDPLPSYKALVDSTKNEKNEDARLLHLSQVGMILHQPADSPWRKLSKIQKRIMTNYQILFLDKSIAEFNNCRNKQAEAITGNKELIKNITDASLAGAVTRVRDLITNKQIPKGFDFRQFLITCQKGA